MKKINLMQNLFAMNFTCAMVLAFSAILASFALLTGCSGFTEDTNTSSNDDGGIIDVQAAFASARVSQLGKVIVDESQDSLTIVYETFGGCLKKDNGVYAYNSDFYFSNSRTYAYSFHGDTLVLSYGSINHEKGSLYDLNFYLIGGNPGDLNGVWMYLPCTSFGDEYGCSNDMENLFIQFNNRSVETRISENKTYDYMNSGFVENLALFMTGHENRIDFDLRGQVMSMDNDLSGKGFTVQERTNKNMKFVYKEHQYELNVDYVQINDSAAVTLSSEGISCTAYLSERDNVSSEMCREENADYLYENGRGSLGYRKDNSDEFASCVKSLVRRGTNTSSNEKSGNLDVQTAFESARLMASGKVFVDEVHDSITLVGEKFGGCVKKGESFMYDSDFYDSDTNKYAYGFRGDTLMFTQPTLLYRDGTGDSVSATTMFFVGGTSGKLDGIWKLLPCRKNVASGEIGCQNDAYDYFVKIDNGKMEYRIADLSDYDYMNSVFVEELFMFLDNQNSIQIETPFYEGRNVESLAKEYEIAIQEKTNRSMRFNYDGHVFDMKLNYAKIMDSVSVTLTSGNVVCNGFNREIPDITQEQCREENAANLNEMESGVYGIRKRNDAEFEDCINGILGRKKESD
ncbi:MAG: hypothetical protein IKH55_06500 [Fibrobacter sp.]|nr:hypothetical protein [Fibrobacter sp.]